MIAQLDSFILKKRPRAFFNRLLVYAFFEGRPLTTSGRWINTIVFAVLRVCKSTYVKGREVKTPLFIVGTGRSGTTILGRVLGVHNDVAFLNEPKAIWYLANEKDDLVGSYSSREAVYRLGLGRNFDMEKTLKSVYGAILSITNSKYIVDKYPELIFRTNTVTTIFPDCIFLAIVRCGVDTCLSVENWSETKSHVHTAGRDSWWGRNDRKWNILLSELVPEHNDLLVHLEFLKYSATDVDRAAIEWIVTMREIHRVMHTQMNILIIKHECMCNDPVSTFSKVIKFCGLPADDVLRSYANEVIGRANTRGDIRLFAGLVEPFISTLCAMGYADSAKRVHSR